ncbi:MAG: hypothetical protein ACOYON_15875 [Fimbriimonas sp.]
MAEHTELKTALKHQYHASLAMLKQAVVLCPDEVWVAGEAPRFFWRIVYHTLFYTNWYMQASSADAQHWEHDRDGAANLHEATDFGDAYTKEQLLQLLDSVDAGVDGLVDVMDLSAPTSGFSWYKMPKLEHQLANLRHIQQHVGQLAEILLANGIDTNWFGRQPATSE